MNRKAIGVVLLLPPAEEAKAVKVNRSLTGTSNTAILLGSGEGIPHISLAMGAIKDDELPQLFQALKNLGAGKSWTIEVDKLHQKQKATEALNSWNIVLTPALLELHNAIMQLYPPLIEEAKPEMLIQNQPIGEGTLHWIKNYKQESAGSNFWPHITLGYGSLAQPFEPFTFQTNRLAVCHLGNRCTCQEILWEL